MKRRTMIFFVTLGLVANLFAEDSFSHKKIQELTQFLNSHQEILQKSDESYDRFFDNEDTSQMIITLLNHQEIPDVLQGLYFLIGLSPYSMTLEEKAQIYLKKCLKHSNPIIHLQGIQYLNAIESLEKPLGEIKEPVEYTLSTQDQKILNQTKKCASYLEPWLKEPGVNIDVPGFIAAFEDAPPSVQFYYTYLIQTEFMLSGNEQLKSILLQLQDKGNIYTKCLVAIALGTKKRLNDLLMNSTNPDEFITLGAFLESSNVPIPLDAWPDKERLQAFFNNASGYVQYKMLKLMELTTELKE